MNAERKVFRRIPRKDIFQLTRENEINIASSLFASITIDEWNRIKDEAVYMAVNDVVKDNVIHMYRITKHIEQFDRVDLTGVELAYDELKGRHYIKAIKYDEPQPVLRGLEFLVLGTGWSIGYVADLPDMRLDIGYVSKLEAMRQIVELTNTEVEFEITLTGNDITKKTINLYKRLSSFKGQRFALGSNALEITREEDTSELVTGLVGVGGTVTDEETEEEYRVNFENIEWSKSAGDPVDKPLGQLYVEIPELTAIYGYPGGYPRIDIEDVGGETLPENVLIETYNQLVEKSRPKMQFKAVVEAINKDMELGETVTILKPGTDFQYQTRVFKIRRDYINNNYTEIEFGDQLVESQYKRLKKLKDEVKDEVKDNIDKVIKDAIDSGMGGGDNGDGDGNGYFKYIYADKGYIVRLTSDEMHSEKAVIQHLHVNKRMDVNEHLWAMDLSTRNIQGAGYANLRNIQAGKLIIPHRVVDTGSNVLDEHLGQWNDGYEEGSGYELNSGPLPGMSFKYQSNIGVYHKDSSSEPDAYVDGYIIDMTHFRSPNYQASKEEDYDHSNNFVDRPPGEYDETTSYAPAWLRHPKPSKIYYLFANDGRIYTSWQFHAYNDTISPLRETKFYPTSSEVYQKHLGYQIQP